MRKNRKVWILFLCLTAAVAAFLIWNQRKEKSRSLAEFTRSEGPSSCAFGDLNYYLPEGCTQELVEVVKLSDWQRIHREKKGQYPDGIRFSVGGTEVGGIDSYYLPENPDWNFGHWVEDLGLWEFEDESLGYSGGSSLYGLWETEFFTDLPGGAPPAVQRYHYFFVSEDQTMAYDLWFDLLTVDRALMDAIVQSCAVGSWGHNVVETP